MSGLTDLATTVGNLGSQHVSREKVIFEIIFQHSKFQKGYG